MIALDGQLMRGAAPPALANRRSRRSMSCPAPCMRARSWPRRRVAELIPAVEPRVALCGTLDVGAVDKPRQPSHSRLGRVEDGVVLKHIVKIGVPAAVLVEDGDAPAVIFSGPEVLLGLELE